MNITMKKVGDDMKRIWKTLIAVMVMITSFSLGMTGVEAREGFEINKHVVEMEVHEDGSILVRETLDVEFLSATLHGIYVNIPADYDMTWNIGEQTLQKSYHFPVIHVKTLSSHKKEITRFSEGVQIKFGDANKYAAHNEVYKFEYEIITRDLDLDGLQMLFMNIVSKGWNTTTAKTEFFISMPKAFDSEMLYFDTPEGVTNTSKGSLNFTVNGNTVSGSYDKTLRPGEAITVQLILPNGYFEFPNFETYNSRSLLAGGSLAVIFAILFYLFGKDDPVVETVEYHAPAGLTSAEVGVIIDGIANDGDVISLILDWGRRGRINIIDNKGSITLEKINELEDTAKNFEHTVFDKLFAKKDTVKISSLTGKFYQTINQAETELDEYFRKGDAQLYTNTSKVLQVICCILSFVPIAIATGSLFHYYYYNVGATFAVIAVDAACIIAATAILIYMDQRRYFHKWSTRFR